MILWLQRSSHRSCVGDDSPSDHHLTLCVLATKQGACRRAPCTKMKKLAQRNIGVMNKMASTESSQVLVRSWSIFIAAI